MNSKLRNRVRPGVSEGGQFSTAARSEPALTLTPTGSAMLPGDYEVDEAYPHPQANDLDKVTTVADAVNGGANTPAAIAQTLDIHEREGAYYAHAAAYLGIIEKVDGDEVTTYATTSLGNVLVASEEDERAELVRQMVAHVPAMAIYDDEGEQAVAQFLNTDGLGQTTAARRAATIVSWARQSADTGSLAGALGKSREQATSRAPDAAAKAREAAEQRRQARNAAQDRQMPPCPSCFTQLPMSGVCDCGYEHQAAA